VSSPQRTKGSTFERAVAAYLQTHGHREAERAYGAGRPDDRGDIAGVAGWVLECKNHARFELAAWCDEAVAEAKNARAPRWAVIHKRRRKGVADAYVTIDLATFAELVGE
jgi:hypothetical protein